jgi:hypothetical protein
MDIDTVMALVGVMALMNAPFYAVIWRLVRRCPALNGLYCAKEGDTGGRR